MAKVGDVGSYRTLSKYLKIKRHVSLDNGLCNTFLSVGRGGEFPDMFIVNLNTLGKHRPHGKILLVQWIIDTDVSDPGGRMKNLAKLFKDIEKREQRVVIKKTNVTNAVQLMIERYPSSQSG